MDVKPALRQDLVEEFVAMAHTDLVRVQQMLLDEPGLVNAVWDWGGGDFETALGAAAHMGAREIADYLLGQGARIDVFAAAMLGRLEIVTAILHDNPKAGDFPGPHGISLIEHAKAGGYEARSVVDFLESLK